MKRLSARAAFRAYNLTLLLSAAVSGAQGNSLAGFRRVAANASLELWANETLGRVAVRSLRDGTVWSSTPPAWESDGMAAGAVKMSMASTISIRYADDLGTMQLANSWVSVVQKDSLELIEIEGGVRFKHRFPREGMTVPVDFILGEDRLDVEIPIAEIRVDRVPKDSPLTQFELSAITLLPFFGAAGSGEKGYILVPDGSGALIGFSNRRTDVVFQEPVYGRDPSVNQTFRKQVTEAARLPVFGMNREGAGGFIAVITSGESKAFINAETAWQRTMYNSASVTFAYKDSDVVSVNDRYNQLRGIRILEREPPDIGAFAVSYFFLPKGKSSYADMAARYRRHLLESGLMAKRPEAGRNPLYLELFGCAVKRKPVLGVPMEVVQDYTRFKDAAAIISDMSEAGARDMVVRYESWTRGGIKNALPLYARAERALGGKRGFKALMKTAAEKGASVYPDVDFLNMYRSNFGRIKELMAARSVLRAPVVLREYTMSTFVKEDHRPSWYLLRPKELPGVASGFMRGFGGLGATGLAPSTLGNLLYSDFGNTDRAAAEAGMVAVLGDLASKSGGLLLDSPFAYALKDASHAVNVPAYSSRYDIETAEVPFYQMVIRGSIPYTMVPGNVHPDMGQWKLKILETGSQPSFRFVFRNSDELVATFFDYLNNADYGAWKDDSIRAWRETSAVLERVRGSSIADHRIISRDVRLTVYDNGIRVAVNYGKTDASIEGGKTVKAGGYAVWEGKAP
jgi:hypothetical protein